MLLLLVLALPSGVALASPTSNADPSEFALETVYGRVLEGIRVVGNTRTHERVVLRELELGVGDIIDHALVEESVRRLRNLRIFTSVASRFDQTQAEGLTWILEVEERWTAIPIAKFGSGGGTRFFTLGAFDINTLGRFVELGAQYENLNGRNGGVTWFRNPRLFDRRLLLGYDLWFTAKNRELFDDDGDRVSAFSFEKTRFHVFVEKEFHRWLAVGTGFDYVEHDISEAHLSGRQRRRNRSAGFILPRSSEQLAFEWNARFGRLNYENYLVEGIQSDWLYRLAVEGAGSTETSNQLTIQTRAFARVFDDHNIGANLSLGHTTASLLQDQFFLGGLAEVRGYRDGQFVGSDFWRANLEYRLPSWESSWIVVQHVAFFDIGSAASSFSKTFERDTFQSVGAGLRIISPRVFRLNLRIDYARTLGTDPGGAFSIGLQQFF